MADSTTRTEPLVSVVVTTYDRPTLLREAVESVQRQTYSNMELIVVDDHSPTPAAETLEGEPDGPVESRVIRHSTNRGANAARNTGIETAEGEFVAFLDDDDRWRPTKVERQVERFRSGGEAVGLVYTGAQSVDADGNVISTFEPTMRGDATRSFFKGAMIGSFSRVMVRSTTIEAAGITDERFPSWQDREWFLRLSRHGEFETVDEPLVIHRSPATQISDDFEKRRDVSYPLFIEKHRSLAAEYGPLAERQFVASLTRTLGASGLRNGHYRDAVRCLLVSLRHYPLWWRTYLYLLLAIGGRPTYQGAKRLKRAYHRFARGRKARR